MNQLIKYIGLMVTIVIFAFAIETTMRRTTEKKPWRIPPKRWVPMYKGRVRNDRSIFVSIASYRDTDCLKTVKELFEKADRPQRLFVGVCQQNKHHNETCADPSFPFSDHVRMMHLDHEEARGPCYARYLCSSLWQGENFFFQIDSHTKFDPHWDTTLINMWESIEDPKAVLGHYPAEYEKRGNGKVPVNCRGEMQANGIIRMAATELDPFETPVKTYWAGANFLFGHGKMIQDVPFDPDLDMLFHGEELLYSARLYTHGYDIYAPNVNVSYHYYGRKEQPKFWNDVPDRNLYKAMQAQSEETVKRILGLQRNVSHNGAYGLGKQRDLRSFWNDTGVDFNAPQTINRCSSL